MDGKLTLAGRKKLLAVVASVISWHLLMYFWSFPFFLCLACDHVSLWLVYYSRVEKKMTNLFFIFGDSLELSISSVSLRLNPLMAESGSREWQCSIYSRSLKIFRTFTMTSFLHCPQYSDRSPTMSIFSDGPLHTFYISSFNDLIKALQKLRSLILPRLFRTYPSPAIQ